MTPKFISPNNWPIFQDWLLIAKDGYRLVALRDGQGLTVRSTRQVRVLELTDSSAKATKKVVEKEIDHVCNEPAITMDETSSDETCRRNLEFTIPKMQAFMLWRLGKGTRLFAIFGRTTGDGTVKVFDGRKEKARLSVTVAGTIRVPAAFHTVRHLRNGKKPYAPHSSTIDEKSTRMALALANGILGQAAIAVELRSYGHADVDRDLGATVDIRKLDGPEVQAIRAQRSQTIVPNVFTVGQVRNNSGTSGSTFEKRDIIIDDREDRSGFARTLAHEFGHVFHLGHVYGDLKKQKRVETRGNVVRYKVPPTRNLMGGGGDEGLNKAQIRIMRKRAQSLAGRGKK